MISSNENLRLFTFVLDWDGGTFVSQNMASSVDESMQKWAGQLDPEQLGTSSEHMCDFLDSVSEETAVPVESLHNVFCFCPTIADRQAVVHIVVSERVRVE